MKSLATYFGGQLGTELRPKLMVGPVLILIMLSMMILPLPPFALDLFFTFNIALSVLVLLVSMFTSRPLEFAAFPAVLLFTTLLRLSLNVASTRVVLLHGHEGGDAAGKVIEAFGHFLVGGNFAVGLAVFIILVIINFMVITKGAGRIAEVGARFMLDAMPGKQMAIDADLNAGLIGEADARQRRAAVAQEAEFYGSMDGASKFVRGDAVAGLIIMAVNVIGGLMIGTMQHGLDFATAAETYTLLTIGDGLVAQIPALVISTAAGVMVSRVDTDQDVGQQMLGQLFVKPQVLILTAGVMGLLGLVPGMPNLVFLFFAGVLAALAWRQMKQKQVQEVEEQAQVAAQPLMPESPEANWDDVQLIDLLGLEVGHRLIPLVDHQQQGELLSRIKGVRKKFAQELGFLPPVVHIRDDLSLGASTYVILLKGGEIGRGEVHPGKWLAIDPGGVTGKVKGIATTDPAFGLPALWIEASEREHAQIYGYTVVDVSTVVATHLSHLLQRHASELLGRREVQQLLDKLAQESKVLVEDVVPKILTLAQLQRLLQNLLAEQVPIRDLRTILDTLAEHAGVQTDVNELTAAVRIELGRALVQQYFPAQSELHVICLDAHLESVLSQTLQGSSPLEPGLANTLMQQAQVAFEKQEAAGEPPVLVVPPALRAPLARFLRRRLKHLAVLSQAEIPEERSLRVTAIIGNEAPLQGAR